MRRLSLVCIHQGELFFRVFRTFLTISGPLTTAPGVPMTAPGSLGAVFDNGEMAAADRLMALGQPAGRIKIKKYYIVMAKYCTICFAVCK